MKKLGQITAYLDRLLETGRYEDDSQNGLQVESEEKNISRVAFAVDSGLSIIEKAIKLKSQLLIVHHGFFWGGRADFAGVMGKKISLLLKSGCSLYTSHLPLDGHMQLGNAALLARFLGLNRIKPFCRLGPVFVGVKAQPRRSADLDHVLKKCAAIPSADRVVVLPFGPKKIKNIGIVTGSGSFALTACAHEKLDLLISGEPKQSAYHLAKELGVNAIFAGHYATETFGVRGLAEHLKKKFKLSTNFIDEPTGI